MIFRSLFHRLYTSHGFRASVVCLKVLFAGHLFQEYGYSWDSGTGPSMLPTFEVIGDSFIVSKKYRRGRGIEVGDLVSCDSVLEPRARVLKRVLGLEGDYVLRDSPDSEIDQMIQVPQGHCWLVGDNLPASRDSRHVGPVPMALIKGKIIARVLPKKTRGWIKNGLQPLDNDE